MTLPSTEPSHGVSESLRLLTRIPVMGLPTGDPGRAGPDASNVAVAAILTPRQPDDEWPQHPVAYESRKLTRRET